MKPVDFRNKKSECMKEKPNELETKSKNKNIRHKYRGIYEFKKSYQPRINLLEHENGDLLADSHNTLNRWKNYFCHLLNVHDIDKVRQTEIHTAEQLVPESNSSEVKISTEKLGKT
jgi:hypothetical protein